MFSVTNLLLIMQFGNIFSHSIGCLFIFVHGFLCCTETLSFDIEICALKNGGVSGCSEKTAGLRGRRRRLRS